MGHLKRAWLALGVACALAGCGNGGEQPKTASASVKPPQQAPAGVKAVQWGESLFQDYGCIACHSINGTRSAGGPLNGIWGETREFADGTETKVDEAYVRESIMRPGERLVAGYEPRMPAYDQTLNDAQLDALIAYLDTLR